jgi:amino acid transporter
MRDGLTRKAVLAVGVVLAIAHPISPSAQTDMSKASHAPGPFRHILLGGEVALSALLFFGGVFFVYLGFQRASDALEHVLDGQRRYWIGVSFWLLIGLGGSLGASGIVTYWLSVCASC